MAKIEMKTKDRISKRLTESRKLAFSKTQNFVSKNAKIKIAVIFAITLGVEVLAQIFYPSDLARPFVNVGGQSVGFSKKSDFEERMRSVMDSSKIHFEFGDKKVEVKYSDLGAEIDREVAAREVFGYDLGQRFLPFSIFEIKNFEGIAVKINDEKLTKFAEKFAAENSIPVGAANIALSADGKIIFENSKSGAKIDASKVKAAILSEIGILKGDVKITIPVEKLDAPRDEEYSALKSRLENILSAGLKLRYEDKNFELSRAEIAGLILLEKTETGVALKINEEFAKNKISELNKKVEQPSKAVKITIEDGIEISREGGENGSKISAQKFIESLNLYFAGNEFSGELALSKEVIPAVEQKSYTFTRTQKGFQAKVAQIARKYPDVKIVVRQLNGDGWVADYRGSESTVSASTYKLFVAMRVFEDMRQNNLNWQSPVHGTTIAGCFDEMIYYSANRCAEAWLAQYGRVEINNFVYSKGFSGATNFNTNGATTTSANDLVNYLNGLYSGGLISGEYRSYLLDLLGRQKWRAGIPTGTAGRAYNKVGFLWDYVNDAAIVEHPRGTYIVAVMTRGSGGYAAIAQITREIEQFMYP